MSSTALDIQEPQSREVDAPTTESAAIFQIVERAARDPNVDIDKMERLILMQERVMARNAELDFDRAMAAAQEEMQPIRADADNPQTKSRYASYAALDAAIRPIYTKHGFSVSFDTAEGAPENCVRIVAKVAHSGGHRERPKLDMPADGKGAKGGDVMTKTHATGAAVQYGRRYLLGMIFNLAVSKDDDGNAAGAAPEKKINADQLATIRRLIDETNSDIQKFCELGKIEALPDMPARQFDSAVRLLEQKKARMAK